MANSKNLLIDVVFGKDSLTKISSADMREFVNYVYDDFILEENIAKDLTSAKQGEELRDGIKSLKNNLTNVENNQTKNTADIQNAQMAISKNSTDITAQQQSIATMQADVAKVLTKVVTNADDIVKNTNAHDALKKEVDAVKVTLHNPNGALDRITKNETAIADINTALGADTTDLKKIENDIKANKDDIDNLNTKTLPAVRKSVTDLAGSTTADLKKIEKKTDDFQKDINANTKGITGVNTAIIAAQTAISNQNLNFTKINTNIAGIESNVAKVLSWEQTITATEQKIENAATKIDATATLADDNKKRIITAEGNITTQDGKITALENTSQANTTTVGDHTKAIGSLQTASQGNQTAIGQIRGDLVNTNSNVGILMTSKTNVDGKIVALQKEITDNRTASDINTQGIKLGWAQMQAVDSKIKTVKDTAALLDTRVGVVETAQSAHETAINQNKTDLTELKKGNTKFQKVSVQSHKDQITIQSTKAVNSQINIIGADRFSSPVWSIGTEPNNTDLVLKADKIRLQSKIATLQQEDPNDNTKTKEYTIIGLPLSVNPTNDGDMLFWNKPTAVAGGTAPAAEWGVQSPDATRTKLSVYSKTETDTKITDAWTTNIADFKTNYLDVTYYTKSDTYSKTEADTKLSEKIQKTPLSDYGTGLLAGSPEIKVWENLKKYTPTAAPADMTVSTSVADLAAAEAEIKKLQTKINDLMAVLKTTGVLV